MFLADPRRTDLALIDHASRHITSSYRWPERLTTLLSGTRPSGVDLVRIDRPGWLLERGWALTPETAGVANGDQAAIGDPVSGLVRSTPDSRVLMIGGRHLGDGGDLDATVTVQFEGRSLHAVLVKPATFFFSLLTLPAGALQASSAYGRLEVAASASDGTARTVSCVVRAIRSAADRSPRFRLRKRLERARIRSCGRALVALVDRSRHHRRARLGSTDPAARGRVAAQVIPPAVDADGSDWRSDPGEAGAGIGFRRHRADSGLGMG